MTDPKRWTETESVATALEQRLLRAGQDLSMPVDQKLAIWSGIASTTSAPALPRSTVVGMPTTLKLLSVVVVTAGLGGLVHSWLTRVNRGTHVGQASGVASSPSTPVPRTPDATSANDTNQVNEPVTPPAVSSAANVPARGAPSGALAAAVSASSAPASPGLRVSLLRDESQATLAIRQALRSSQALTALKLLDDAQRRFGNGVLGEEREALRIEALAHTGNRTQAASRAKAFLSAHPRSPHASDVRRYLAE